MFPAQRNPFFDEFSTQVITKLADPEAFEIIKRAVGITFLARLFEGIKLIGEDNDSIELESQDIQEQTLRLRTKAAMVKIVEDDQFAITSQLVDGLSLCRPILLGNGSVKVLGVLLYRVKPLGPRPKLAVAQRRRCS
jgi:hypothetical protein